MGKCHFFSCCSCLGAMLKNAGRFFERMKSDDGLVNECQKQFKIDHREAIEEIIRKLRAGERSPEKLELRELSGGFFGETRSLAHTQVESITSFLSSMITRKEK